MKKTILLLVVVLLATGCSVSLKSDAPEKLKEDVTSAVTEKAGEVVEESTGAVVDTVQDEIVKELTAKEISISSSSISPVEISVLENEEIKLKISSSDNKVHGFYMPDFEITETIPDSGTEVVSFKADQKGSFTYTCNLNCDSGVKGTLNVK